MSTAWFLGGWCTRALIGLSFTSCPFGAPAIVSSGRILPTQRGESSAVDTEAWLCCSLLWDEVTVCKHNTVFHSYSRALDLIPGDSGILITHSWYGQAILMNNKLPLTLYHPFLSFWQLCSWAREGFAFVVVVVFSFPGGKLCVWLSIHFWGQRNAFSVWVTWLEVINGCRD